MPGTLAGKRRLGSCRRGRSLYLRPALPVGRIPLVGVALGIFGIAEIIDLLAKGGQIAERIALGRGWLQGVKDVIQHWGIVVRGSLIGVWAGILPGIGATAGSWMAYGHVVAMARDRERFGKGDIRGVIGPESANNSVEAGDFIPTLLFSVPGGAPSAILLGALFFYGIQPGPRMVQENLDLIFTIIWSFAIANTIGAALCFCLSPALARLTWIPFARLAPAIVVTIFFGAFQSSQNFGDIYRHARVGTAGLAHETVGLAARAFSGRLRFDQADRTVPVAIDQPLRFRMALAARSHRSGPIAACLHILDRPGKRRGKDIPAEESGEGAVLLGKVPSVLFTFSFYLSSRRRSMRRKTFPYLGAIFPMAATIPAIFMAAAQIVLEVRATRAQRRGPRRGKKTKLTLGYFFSLVLYLLLILFFGFGIATAIFTFFFFTPGSARAGSMPLSIPVSWSASR